MLIRIVKLSLKPERKHEFLTFYANSESFIKKQPGCLDVQLLQSMTDDNELFTYSKWASEDDLNAYRNSDFFRDLWPRVKPCFSAKAAAWSLMNLDT